MSSSISWNGLGIVLLTLASLCPVVGAAGPTGESVAYELRAGSYLLNDCPICDHLSRPIPLEGKLVVAELLVPGAGIRVFQITDINLHTSANEYSVTGTGSYDFGVVNPNPTQALTLDAEINGEAGIKLQGADLPIGDPWPLLDITVDEITSSESRVYHIHIVAKPATDAAPFRRGEANGDGGIDLSDAVKVLRNQFMGEPIPCQKAADANDDGAVDIADAVYLLSYLFLGGPAPGEPLASCGFDPTPDGLTCESFTGCR